MPTQRSRLSRTKRQEYRTCLLELEEMGISIERASDLWHEPTRLTLEQILHPLAAVYELPGGEVAVVVLAKLTVLISGILITDLELATPWDGPSLDLSDPEGTSFYQDVTRGLYPSPPKVLNHLLKRERPLRCCQVEGVIVATGWSPVPPECHDKTPVKVKLVLTDERSDELAFEFEAHVDGSVKRKYEWLQKQRGVERSSKRVSIFEREDGQLGHQKSVPPEEAHQGAVSLR